MKTLAVIPARGGSKGLPGKNIMEIAGKPLLAWTIENALKSELLSEIIVSTNDEKIKEVALSYGCNVPFLRPEELSGDDATSVDVVLHSIDYFRNLNVHFDNIVLLEPTSPLRKKNDIDLALNKLYNNYDKADGIVSIGEIHLENPAVVKYVENDLIFPLELNSNQKCVTRRQDYPRYFFPYGVLYIIKTKSLIEKRSFYTDKILPFFIERWQNYELDDIYDFYVIEAIFKNKIKEDII